MASRTPPSAMQTLQRIQDCVKRGENELALITSPEVMYEENLTRIKTAIDEAFQKIYLSTEDLPHIKADIISCAGQLKILEIDRKTILLNASIAYKSQVYNVAQNVCDMLVAAMGQSLVKKALVNMASSNSQGLLPEENPRDYQQPIFEGESLPKRPRTSQPNNCSPESQNVRATDHTGSDGTENSSPQTAHERTEAHPREISSTMTRINRDPAPKAQLAVVAKEHTTVSTTEVAVNVTIINTKGDPIGVIRKIHPWNQYIQAILGISVLREVKIRHDLGFSCNNVDYICDRSDPRGTRLLACMIQAGGNVMNRLCEYCQKNEGPFEGCIMLSDTSFPRCGNCEWGHQRCRDASTASDAEHADGVALKESGSKAAAGAGIAHSWQILQIKTRLFASDEATKQYVMWIDTERCFKHRILIASKPQEKWGRLCEPIEFDIQLEDISEIKWNVQAWLVYIRTKHERPISKIDQQPRGDIMVAFEGPNTVLRFLEFCVKWNVRMVKEEPEKMVGIWHSMKSRTVLHVDSNLLKYDILDT